jgi:hypothetical protein
VNSRGKACKTRCAAQHCATVQAPDLLPDAVNKANADFH